MSSKVRKVLVVGKTPPPVGGVTVFVKYFIEAVNLLPGYKALSFSWFRLFEGNYDVAHVNSSNNLKRVLWLICFKVFRKKVYFVKHGGIFNVESFWVRAAFNLADGVFCLNDEVRRQLDALGVNNMMHSTVFEENAACLSSKYPKVDSGSDCRVLFYINNARTINGEEVYGASFFCSLIDKLPKDCLITIVDLSGAYRERFSLYGNVRYMSDPTDFCRALTETDIYVRCTSTDGMSVALIEAGLIGVKCLASDIVPRPDFVNTYRYGDHDDFIKEFDNAMMSKNEGLEVKLASVTAAIGFMYE